MMRFQGHYRNTLPSRFWVNLLSFILLGILWAPRTWAWGERGHHLVCSLATDLVKDPELKIYLRARRHTMGHLCNVPDIYWRSLGEKAKAGDASHFINPEKIAMSVDKIPASLDALKALAKTDPKSRKADSKKDIDFGKFLDSLGSNWWRAQQFFQMAVQHGQLAQKAKTPLHNEEQKWDLPYNAEIFAMTEAMGFLGHFVGDVMMPFHNTQDYDGWDTGHGGIHAFYENRCVDFYDVSIDAKVLAAAQSKYTDAQINEWATQSIPEIMKKLSMSSLSDMPELLAKDKTLKKSVLTKRRKEVAMRDEVEKACPPFYPLIEKELALSTATLAYLWDRIYAEAAKPNLRAYKAWHYPTAPEFVPLNYTDN